MVQETPEMFRIKDLSPHGRHCFCVQTIPYTGGRRTYVRSTGGSVLISRLHTLTASVCRLQRTTPHTTWTWDWQPTLTSKKLPFHVGKSDPNKPVPNRSCLELLHCVRSLRHAIIEGSPALQCLALYSETHENKRWLGKHRFKHDSITRIGCEIICMAYQTHPNQHMQNNGCWKHRGQRNLVASLPVDSKTRLWLSIEKQTRWPGKLHGAWHALLARWWLASDP